MTLCTRSLLAPLFSLLACGGSIGGMDGADGGPDTGGDGDEDSMVGISPSLFELAPGETISLQAVVLDGSGSPMPGATVTWSSSSSGAATVTSSGLVTAVGAGSVSITATWEQSSGISLGSIVAADAEPEPDPLPEPDPSCCDAGISNFCMLAPSTAGCPMTDPGGYCDPNGDGSYTEPGTDENWRTGREHYDAFCGYTAEPTGDCCRPDDADVTNFCHLPPDTAGCTMTARGGYCDPNRDADYTDGDWVHGYFHYQQICGG
jgi:hypothetical protein